MHPDVGIVQAVADLRLLFGGQPRIKAVVPPARGILPQRRQAMLGFGQVRNDQHQCGGNIHGDAAILQRSVQTACHIVTQPVAEIHFLAGKAGPVGGIDRRLAGVQGNILPGEGIVIQGGDKNEVIYLAIRLIDRLRFLICAFKIGTGTV